MNSLKLFKSIEKCNSIKISRIINNTSKMLINKMNKLLSSDKELKKSLPLIFSKKKINLKS
jgi:hypothetical protein